MIIDLLQAKKGGNVPFVREEDAGGWDDPLDVAFAGPIRVEGEYRLRGEAVLVSGHISAMLATQCGACLTPITVPVEAEFSDIFREEPDLEEGEYPYEGSAVRLDKMILDELSLQMPARFLCREDCKGLCPVCGANRNEVDCGCEEGEDLRPNPFDKLKNLF